MLAEEIILTPKATLDDNGWDESFSCNCLGKNCLMIEIFNHFFIYNSKSCTSSLKVQAGIYFKMKKDYRFPTVQAVIWKRHNLRALREHTLVPWRLQNMTSDGDKPLVFISISE